MVRTDRVEYVVEDLVLSVVSVRVLVCAVMAEDRLHHRAATIFVVLLLVPIATSEVAILLPHDRISSAEMARLHVRALARR